MLGKSLRSYRLFDVPSRRALIVPMDHTFSMGMVDGLMDVPGVLQILRDSGCDGVVLHKGAIERLVRRHGPEVFSGLTIIAHLTGATSLSPAPARQTLLADVEEALALGADWVSVQVNFGCNGENEMLSDLGTVTKQAYRWGVPVLAMVYVRNNEGDVVMDSDKILHSARSAADLGVEAVKIPFVPSDVVRRLTSTVPVEVVVGGGVKQDEGPFLENVRQIIMAGASGVCIGRNFFQSANPTAFIARLKHILRDPEVPFSEEATTRCA
jgi:fructose-bisphosphate aldolase/2-amino-3,7-dideoxy-D-threo-hept-6-ulosonate synthase